MKKKDLRKLIYSAVFLALCMVLPFLTGQIQTIGQMLSPMHFPVLLCGFVCGPWYGLAVGFTAPLLRSLIFGMPKLFPAAIAMAFELAAYGLLTGVLNRVFPKKPIFVYATLIVSMIGGRAVWGAVRFVCAGFNAGAFPFSAFISGAITTAVPGIIAQLIIIPILVFALSAAKVGDLKE